jgi:4-alpha-glucanotransferase
LAASRQSLSSGRELLPPLVTADAGKPVAIGPLGTGHGELELEDGRRRSVQPVTGRDGRTLIEGVLEPGYHRLCMGDREASLAVAPARCWTVHDLAARGGLWGVAAQIYGLRCAGDYGIGDLGGVAALAGPAARCGADAIALSPLHALFAADVARYAPYSPSSRRFLNPLYANPDVVLGADFVASALQTHGSAAAPQLETADLIDWPVSAKAKFAALRSVFASFKTGRRHRLATDFANYRAVRGCGLELHARFEALHAARTAANGAERDWRSWPAAFRDPGGDAVAEFAASHADEVEFHCFLQWLAEASLAVAQRTARNAGMRIGLITDLAVGMDSSGSEAWSLRQDVLSDLLIGAPPDFFNPAGQNWGSTALSPRALRGNGFAPMIETLRTAMRYAGGVRIDHVMGLARLWVIPEGATPAEGAYIVYPLVDLLRLISLESYRHQAIVLGEDLGTVPDGFRETLDRTGIFGLRVLLFERKQTEFRPPEEWPENSVAMTSTHDLSPIAGWWAGRDLALRAQAGWEIDSGARDIDRAALWQAFCQAGAVAPHAVVPAKPDAVVDGAMRFISLTRSKLALLPLEDLLGLDEQPNVPGTVNEYPNWRRRYPLRSDRIFDAPAVRARTMALNRRKHR